jgi:hypothetical protein
MADAVSSDEQIRGPGSVLEREKERREERGSGGL